MLNANFALKFYSVCFTYLLACLHSLEKLTSINNEMQCGICTYYIHASALLHRHRLFVCAISNWPERILLIYTRIYISVYTKMHIHRYTRSNTWWWWCIGIERTNQRTNERIIYPSLKWALHSNLLIHSQENIGSQTNWIYRKNWFRMCMEKPKWREQKW